MAETHNNLLSVRGRSAAAVGATFRISIYARIAPTGAKDRGAKGESPLLRTLSVDLDGWDEGNDSDRSV
jgi:hypothetical protein